MTHWRISKLEAANTRVTLQMVTSHQGLVETQGHKAGLVKAGEG